MDKTLREHISRLEERVRQLSEAIMSEANLSERNRIEAEIRAANMALSHYRAALEVENALGFAP